MIREACGHTARARGCGSWTSATDILHNLRQGISSRLSLWKTRVQLLVGSAGIHEGAADPSLGAVPCSSCVPRVLPGQAMIEAGKCGILKHGLGMGCKQHHCKGRLGR